MEEEREMKVLVLKCSDYSYEEELEAKEWNEIMKELLSRYPSWVIEPIYEHLKRRHPVRVLSSLIVYRDLFPFLSLHSKYPSYIRH